MSFVIVDNYFLRHGPQMPRLLSGLRGNSGKSLVLEAFIAPHIPQVFSFAGAESMDECLQARDWDVGEETAYDHFSRSILNLTPYSPALDAKAAGEATVFEWRIYHSGNQRQLRALHQRFEGPEIPIFHRCGIHPMFYGETVAGVNLPSVAYLTPFANLAAREKAWGLFLADPEWARVRDESIEANGQIATPTQVAAATHGLTSDAVARLQSKCDHAPFSEGWRNYLQPMTYWRKTRDSAKLNIRYARS